MSKQHDSDVEAIVQQILDEVEQPFPPMINTLKARAAKLSRSKQATLLERAMEKNPPLLATSSPEPPSPG